MARQSLVKNKRKLLNPIFHTQTKNEEEEILTEELIKVIRRTGSLNLSGRNLTTVPDKMFHIYELTDQDYSRHVDFSRNSDETEDTWWNFKPLNYIDFSSNQLQKIPAQIDYFDCLETCIFHDNNLTTVPPSLGKLRKLKKINLSRNKIEELPNEFFDLLELEWLSLSHNSLDKISKKTADLVMLLYLDISHNELVKLPPGLGFLVRLTELNLSNNKLIQLPPDIVNMRGLRKLDVTNNELKLFPRIYDMRRLEFVFAQHNNLIELPDFEDCQNIQELYFGNNYIKEVPIAICENLHHLKILDLRDNKIAELPDQIGMLQGLIRLDITNNDLDSLPNSICFLPHLQNLQLEGNKLVKIRRDVIKGGTFRILKFLRDNIVEEEMKDSRVTDSVILPTSSTNLPDKFKMKNSRILNLALQDLKSVPDETFENACWAEVSIIDICKNKLTEFPQGLVKSKDFLKELNLSKNLIREVPHFVGDFKHLIYLNFSNNQLSDLPLTMSSLVYLRELAISNNKFSNLPSCIYDLKGLEILMANDNQISEMNVEGLKKLTNLAALNLSNNSISHVPPEVGLLKQLRNFEIQGNLFRQPRHTILEQGTECLLAYLRDRIPTN